jgi:probable rRNA maturation factor
MHDITVQHAFEGIVPVSDDTLIEWANLVLADKKTTQEVTIRLTSEAEIQSLNLTYRQKDKPTNVLAFPYELPTIKDMPFEVLGDIVICPAVLKTESEFHDKPIEAHWAHIVIHGLLHLLGHDHSNDEDTPKMQALEQRYLAQLGFANPYDEEGEFIE